MPEKREIRIFVSSTFSDMRAEREELVKRVFPQLRNICERRGASFSDVDLRWGITDEQKAEGQVLPICLAEIERCHPYFIGLLGERYGHIQKELDPDLVSRAPWLFQYRDRSVTELEILHGVLNNPAIAEHAFFYFRDPAYIDSLPSDQQRLMREEPRLEDIQEYGEAEAGRRAAERRQKLVSLKQRIREGGFPVRENYRDPIALSELVLADFTRLIDKLYPEGSKPSPLDREVAAHETFCRSRARIYIGRQEYFDRLDEHVQSDGPPLAVLGNSGLGKSALLANWSTRYRATHPNELLIAHFIGASPASADWSAVLRRIMGEFKRHLDVGPGEGAPTEPYALRMAFANALYMAAARRRVVIILDALNQLEDRDQAPDLARLPPVIPTNVRLVVSTLPGRSLEEIVKRQWPTMHVEPLKVDERKLVITKYLAQYAKALTPNQTELICAAWQTANPLYLRALLEELRVWGEHATLDTRIRHYLAATSIDGLYQKILARYEEDYDRDRPGLVRDAMSLICAARHGLSEPELLDLLGTNERPLPHARWSPLYLAAEHSLVSRSGVLTFFHQYFRDAVSRKYLASEAQQRTMRLRLADYFTPRENDLRKIEELPWQLSQTKSWQRLYKLLADLPFYSAAHKTAQWELRAYWAQLESNSSLRMTEAYMPVLQDPAAHASELWSLSLELDYAGYRKEAFHLVQTAVDLIQQVPVTINPNAILDDAVVAKLIGITGPVTPEAMASARLAIARNQLAFLMGFLGDLDGAIAILGEVEPIFRKWSDKSGTLATCLGNKAVFLRFRGQPDAAMLLLKEVERISRELADREPSMNDVLQAALGEQARILKRHDPDGALKLLKEKERICRAYGYVDGQQASLYDQAEILVERKEPNKAMDLLEQQEQICRQFGSRDGLHMSLSEQARILEAWSDLDGALALSQEDEKVCRELRLIDGLVSSLGSQVYLLEQRADRDHQNALVLLNDLEGIAWELKKFDILQQCLHNKALIVEKLGDLDGALTLFREQEQVCRHAGIKSGLQDSLHGQGRILKDRRDFDAAMTLFKEQERICRELHDEGSLQDSLGEQGLILWAQGKPRAALALLTEQEGICRQSGNTEGLLRSLGNQALILEQQRDPKGAMALHQEQERISRHFKLPHGLARALLAQAHLLKSAGRPKEALPIAEEAYVIATEHRLFSLVQPIKQILLSLRANG